MRLEWDRRGVVRMTAKVEELAALLAGARLAARALESRPAESTSGLRRVLTDFDRALRRLTSPGPASQDVGTAPIVASAPPCRPTPGGKH